MGDPRFWPRDFCDRPEAFGLSPDLRFAPLTLAGAAEPTAANDRRHLDNEAFAAGAQWQHEHALVIRRILDREGLSIRAYANLVGESAKRIRAVLAGTAVLRPDDVERADRLLGSVKLVVRVNARRRKLREIQAAIDEIEHDSEPWGRLPPQSGKPGGPSGDTRIQGDDGR